MNLNSSPPTWPGEPLLDEALRSLPGIVFREGDELRHRLERQRGRDRQKEVSARDQRDRLQVPLDVVRQLRHHVAGDGERADRPHADGVAVRFGLGGQIETDGQRPARTVVDHDLLAQFLCELGAEDARDRIGRAAGSLWDDEPDRSIRILRRRAGRKRAGEQRKGKAKHAQVAPFACRHEVTARHFEQFNTVRRRNNGLAPFSATRDSGSVSLSLDARADGSAGRPTAPRRD
jgi:hypothetical protein